MIGFNGMAESYVLGNNGIVYKWMEDPDYPGDPEEAYLEPMGGYGVADLWHKPEERMQ